MFNPKLHPRRGSYEITNHENMKLTKAFPVRGRSSQLLTPAPVFDPSKRRHSESILPNIKTKDRRTNRILLIDKKDIPEVNAKFGSPPREPLVQEEAENQVEREEHCVSLPRIPSVTPEPEIIRREGQKEDTDNGVHVKLPEIEQAPSYRPKYCWCLRCQLMFTMFRTGDPHLENWGNYPCFQR